MNNNSQNEIKSLQKEITDLNNTSKIDRENFEKERNGFQHILEQ